MSLSDIRCTEHAVGLGRCLHPAGHDEDHLYEGEAQFVPLGLSRAGIDEEIMQANERTRRRVTGNERLDDPNAKASNPKDVTAAVEGRVPLGLFPDTAVVAGAMAMWEGARKYGRYNYRIAGVRASVYRDALDRHIKAWWNGADIDPDSGLPHLWKALACLAILIDAEECDMLTDDRPPVAPVEQMLRALKMVVNEIEERTSGYDPYQPTIADKPS